LGFFIIVLILVAGCSNAQYGAARGSNSQNPASGNNQMTAAETKAVPLWSYATKNPINSVAISADGQYVAAGSGDGFGTMISYYSHDGKLLWNYSSNFSWVIGISSDGQKVIVNDQWNIVYFSREGKRLLEYPKEGDNYHYAISADGQYVFATGSSYDNRCHYVKGVNGRGAGTVCTIPPLIHLYGDKLLWSQEVKEDMAGVAMSADGQYMATGKNKVYYFSRAGNLLWSREVEAEMADVAMSADGQHVVAGTQGAAGEVYYFSQDGRLLWNYATKNPITSIDLSADGQYVVAGTQGAIGEVYYFSQDGRLLWNQKTANGENIVDISADGQYVVARTFAKAFYFSHDGTLLWSQLAGGTFATNPESIAISSNGQNVVLGSHAAYGDSKVYFFSRD
jgi:WD40 repeat protein